MAQFIFGNSVKDQLNKWPAVRNSIWWLEALILGTLLRILSWIPMDTASAFGKRFGKMLGPRLPKHQSILRNLRLAFPQKTEAEVTELAMGVWENAGAVLTEFVNLEKMHRTGRIKIAVDGYIDAFNRQDRSVVFVGAHLSNWEVMASAITRMIHPVSAPYAPPKNPWLARQLTRYRSHWGFNLLAREGSARQLFEAVSDGQSLVFLMDQRVDTGRFAPFLGKDKLTTLVPARIALQFGCEIVPVRVERQQGANYVVTFYPSVTPDTDTADEKEQALQVTRKINQHFETWIRAKPSEWFCSNRMWSKKQASEI